MTIQEYPTDLYAFIVPCLGDIPPEGLREALKSGFDQQWSTTQDGGVDMCTYQDSTTDPRWYPTDLAIEKFLSSEDGCLNIFTEHTDFMLQRNTLEAFGQPEINGIALFWYRIHFKSILHRSDDRHNILSEVFDAVRLIYKHTPAPFAFSQLPHEHEHETSVTQQHVETPELPDAFWLMLLSPAICDDIGRSRLESASVWKTKELDDGGIGMIATDDLNYTHEHKKQLRDHLALSE